MSANPAGTASVPISSGGGQWTISRTANPMTNALTVAIAVLSLAVLALWKKCPDPLLVALGAAVGLAMYRIVRPEWLLR